MPSLQWFFDAYEGELFQKCPTVLMPSLQWFFMHVNVNLFKIIFKTIALVS